MTRRFYGSHHQQACPPCVSKFEGIGKKVLLFGACIDGRRTGSLRVFARVLAPYPMRRVFGDHAIGRRARHTREISQKSRGPMPAVFANRSLLGVRPRAVFFHGGEQRGYRYFLGIERLAGWRWASPIFAKID